jgi:competence protein ComEA
MFDFTRQQLIAAGVIIALALVGTGILLAKVGVFGPTGGQIRFIEPGGGAGELSSSDGLSQTGDADSEKICVHVVGKVNKPGLYELDPGSRITDAIKAAGGAFSNADLENINLAERLIDGEQIYVAVKGVSPLPKVSTVRGAERTSSVDSQKSDGGHRDSGPAKLSTPGQGTVNINTAGLNELQRLPRIGPAMAQRIIDYRNKNGRFNSIEELDEVKGIGPATLEKLRPFVKL